MAKKNFMKKVASVVLSATVVMTSLPATAFAADFNDSDVISTDETVETAETTSDVSETSEDLVEDEQENLTTDASSDEETEEAGSTSSDGTESEVYVMMNIPYAEFYKAELNNNDVAVDAFTSATHNKSRTKNGVMANGSYHVNSDGSDITGITFPVKVSDLSVLAGQKEITDDSSVEITVSNRGQTSTTTYTGMDALFESASYSYYVLSEAPSYYKELTVAEDGSFSFSTATGAEAQTVTSDASFTTETGYGDYQLNIDSTTFGENIDINSDTIYGVTVNTTDGTNYGLRHVENIWRGCQLAWCTGFTTSVHNCPTSSAHYVSMMGKTIDSVTYYTSKGIITFDIPDTKVVTTTGIAASVADMDVNATSTSVSFDKELPSDFAAKYSIDGNEVSCKSGKISVSGLALGSHELTISDTSNNYASISASFTVTTNTIPVSFDTSNKKLVAAKGYSADDLASYIKNISSVTVDGTEYEANERFGKIIVKEDGSLDLTDLTVTKDSEFVVKATGYAKDLTFTYTARVFKLNASSKTLYTAGSSSYTKATLKVTTNLKGNVTWKSSNNKYATVSSKGVVTAKKKGTVTITATCGSYKATCKITVKEPTLKLSKTSATLKKGKKTTIKAKGTPTGKISYKSSNKKIAIVSSKGVVTAKKKGTVKITVTCNGVKKTFKVKVK